MGKAKVYKDYPLLKAYWIFGADVTEPGGTKHKNYKAGQEFGFDMQILG